VKASGVSSLALRMHLLDSRVEEPKRVEQEYLKGLRSMAGGNQGERTSICAPRHAARAAKRTLYFTTT
jgi:hypothetical protein